MAARKKKGRGGRGKKPGPARDALGRRRRAERRAKEAALRRRAARAQLPRVWLVRLMQRVLAEDCARGQLSARGAAAVCGVEHPTARGQLQGEGKGCCDSLDKLIEHLVDDKVVFLRRLIAKVKAIEKRGR